ncbi:MAG: sulfatase [Opitutales bacterium]
MRPFAALCLLVATLGLSAADRPNILLILGDNWRFPHAGVLGDPHARTPAFDRVAREGVLFTHAFNPAPSCSPCRSSLLTGRAIHELGERASLWSGFPQDTPVFTQLLREAGYAIGYHGKPWAPGNFEASGWKENPVGPKFPGLEAFLRTRRPGQPFFFWLGNTDTATKAGRRPCLEDAQQAGLDPKRLPIPPELPDCEEVRLDLLNYYGGIIRMDREATAALAVLEAAGELDRTLVVYTGDNGWQMPRGLGNCYDQGSRVPLAVRWGGAVKGGRSVDAFVSLGDLGPTFLEAAGLTPPKAMTMRSLAGLLRGAPAAGRDAAFIGRERHADVRNGHLSYPMRAVRTRDFLYVRNLRPDRWPAGDPDNLFLHGRPFGDVDTTATKDFLLAHKDDLARPFFARIFGKRPSEELYDLRKDPHQLTDVAADPAYAADLAAHRARVDAWMRETRDPRLDPAYDAWDSFPYYGKAPK